MADSLDWEISALIEQGAARLEAEGYAAAAPFYRSVLQRRPELSGCWHDLGIATKHLGLWEECRAVNRRALELDPADDGAAWNLGIAGTALGDWATARTGWRAAGVALPEGNGPPEMNLGRVPIRVNVAENPEVVWCERIDPARAIILSVPTAASGRRHRDLVLHDGSRAGERLLDGRTVPVFNELELLAPSAFSTYELRVEVDDPRDLVALEKSLDGSGGVGEDWTASVRSLCKACSEGNPDAGAHAHPSDDGGTGARAIGFATTQEEAAVHALVARWLDGRDQPLLRRLTGSGRRTLRGIRRVIAGATRA